MPEVRLEKQHKKFKKYFEERKMVQSIYAMELVDKYHTGERRGGGPERSHLYEVAGQTLAFLEGRVSAYNLDCVVAASFLELNSMNFVFDSLKKEYLKQIAHDKEVLRLKGNIETLQAQYEVLKASS